MRQVQLRPVAEVLSVEAAIGLWIDSNDKILAAMLDGRAMIPTDGYRVWGDLSGYCAVPWESVKARATAMYLFDDQYEFAAWLLSQKPLKETK